MFLPARIICTVYAYFGLPEHGEQLREEAVKEQTRDGKSRQWRPVVGLSPAPPPPHADAGPAMGEPGMVLWFAPSLKVEGL